MRDPSRTNAELIEENALLEQRIQNLEQLVLDHKKVEETLRESGAKYRLAFESTSDGVFTIDHNFNISSITPSVERELGYKIEEVINKPIQDLNILTSESLTRAVSDVMQVLSGMEIRCAVYEFIAKDGTRKFGEVTGTPIICEGKILGVTAVVRDITRRKQAEEALRLSEENYRNLFENANEAIFVVQDGKLVFLNPMTNKMIGYSSEELTSRSFIEFIHSDDRDMVMERHIRRMKGEDLPHVYSFRIIQRDGNVIWVELNAVLIKWKGKAASLNFLTDITERKRTQEQIHQQSKLLTAINTVFFETLTADSEETVAKTCLKVTQELTGSKFGFIGEITPEGLFTTTAVSDPSWEACRIPESGANVLIKDMVIRGIWGQVLLKGQSLIVNDPASYHDRVGIPEGHPPLTSFLGVPLKDQGKVIGMIAMANRGSGYTSDHQQDMEALSVIFVEAIRRKQAEKNLKETLESLRRAFGSIVQVMVSAVESRDPYTAGHQLRSADLARAIATEMGCTHDRIEGVRMAGSIHDIGKLSIPAEILSKPTKLTNIEFRLIKEHSRSGYEILREVESTWPLAQIVYQHHERMDGSGYPRNLKGEEICIEARILAVADVVEAMASHRPYRPALGIDAALKEIEKNRGILYDNTVADACLRLFREKRFRLKGT